MGKLINRIPGLCLLISNLPGSALRMHVELLGKPHDVNKCSQSLGILNFYACRQYRYPAYMVCITDGQAKSNMPSNIFNVRVWILGLCCAH